MIKQVNHPQLVKLNWEIERTLSETWLPLDSEELKDLVSVNPTVRNTAEGELRWEFQKPLRLKDKILLGVIQYYVNDTLAVYLNLELDRIWPETEKPGLRFLLLSGVKELALSALIQEDDIKLSVLFGMLNSYKKKNIIKNQEGWIKKEASKDRSLNKILDESGNLIADKIPRKFRKKPGVDILQCMAFWIYRQSEPEEVQRKRGYTDQGSLPVQSLEEPVYEGVLLTPEELDEERKIRIFNPIILSLLKANLLIRAS